MAICSQRSHLSLSQKAPAMTHAKRGPALLIGIVTILGR